MADGRSPKHFVTLDGLRGVAAIAVVIFHRQNRLPFGGHLLDHAYLAVDFFFVLSGFVIAHAYDRPLIAGTLSPGRFTRLRIIRLYPLIFAGALIGAGAVAWRAVHGQGDFQLTDLVVLLPLAMLAIPTPAFISPTMSYPLNPPSWSVGGEIAVNLVYAFLARRLTTRVLIAIAVAAFCVEAWGDFHVGVLGDIGTRAGPIPPVIARVIFPFTVGILLNRAHVADRLPRLPIGLVVLAVAVAATFAPPLHLPVNYAYDLFCVAIVYPLIVMAGCQHQPSGPLLALATASGEISYPLYALHWPVLMWLDIILHGHTLSWRMQHAVFVGIIPILVVGSWFAFRIDAQVRRVLSSRLWISRPKTA